MAYTAIDDPSAHFQIALYTGNESGQSITNDGNSDLQPDLVWIKNRGDAHGHQLQDSTRGVGKALESNNTDAEATGTVPDNFTAFGSDGFTLGAGHQKYNDQDDTYVAWQWKANGGTRVTFTESGDNPAGGYQANTTAGFSIVDYVGTGAAGTIAHGLGAVPEVIIVKTRDGVDDYPSYWKNAGTSPEDYAFKFNLTASATSYDDAGAWNDTIPTSSVFTVGSANYTNKNDDNLIAYVFTPIQGYSKFGIYTGNGNADGPFIYTGFKPAWVLIKETTSGNTNDWNIYDSKRSAANPMDDIVEVNLSDAEGTGRADIDFLSNGFKQRNTHADSNRDDGTFVYMAFAEQPFVTSGGVPCTAR